MVVAHPGDEYAFAANTYRMVRELGWAADQVIVTNGDAGYRYSAPAEAVYGVALLRKAMAARTYRELNLSSASRSRPTPLLFPPPR